MFADANRSVTKKLSDIPTALEPTLDMSFIEALSREPMPPGSITAGWHVYIETHFLGGTAMFYNWEIADIGLLIQIRHRGKLARAKIALLQSKRLYADEIRKLPDLRRKYQQGFFSLVLTDEDHRLLVGGRTFHFTEKSLYREYRGEGRAGEARRAVRAGPRNSRLLPLLQPTGNPVAGNYTLLAPCSEYPTASRLSRGSLGAPCFEA